MLIQLIKDAFSKRETDYSASWFCARLSIVPFVLDWLLPNGSTLGVLCGVTLSVAGLFYYFRSIFGRTRSIDPDVLHNVTHLKSILAALLMLAVAILFICRGVMHIQSGKLAGAAVLFLMAVGAIFFAFFKFDERPEEN